MRYLITNRFRRIRTHDFIANANTKGYMQKKPDLWRIITAILLSESAVEQGDYCMWSQRIFSQKSFVMFGGVFFFFETVNSH